MIFADTSGFLALMDRGDQHHAAARDWLRDVAGRERICTTDFVLDEVLTRISTTRGPDAALAAFEKIAASPSVLVVYVDRELFDGGLAEVRRFRDKRLSFTDCVSFAVMRSLRVVDAFAFDDDFVRCGFRCVPI